MNYAYTSVASIFFSTIQYLLYFVDLASKSAGTWNVIFITASMINAQMIHVLIQIFENNFLINNNIILLITKQVIDIYPHGF